jgi:SAM-dependent methyltransferase
VRRSLRQLVHLARAPHARNAAALRGEVEISETRLADCLGRTELSDLSILEIGPGQSMERAQYFGRRNMVTAIDLDEIVDGFDLAGYRRMRQSNGWGRMIKTLGRSVLISPRQRRAWKTELGIDRVTPPNRVRGDFCDPDVGDVIPGFGEFDVVMSWSVFEHLSDPKTAVQAVVNALAPGGVFLLSIHNYTANDGHHDIRAFSGGLDALPPWGHLRESTRSEIHPSAYLNEWRLQDWQSLFDDLTPGAVIHLDSFEHPERFGPLLDGSLAAELAEFSPEELLTVNIVATWRKPLAD